MRLTAAGGRLLPRARHIIDELDAALADARSPPYRPLDTESPALDVSTLIVRDLVVAVGSGHLLARRRAVEVDELVGQVGAASPSEGGTRCLASGPGWPRGPTSAMWSAT